MVRFLKIFYSLYHLSFLSLLPIHTFFFFFFLFFSSTRCHLYLLLLFALSSSFNNIPSFQLVQVQFSFSSALSIFFFFNLIPEGIMDKVFFISFPFSIFFLIWGDKICGPGRENFLLGFPLSLFSPLSQTVENNVFYSVFPSMFSIPPKITPTKHSVSPVLVLG